MITPKRELELFEQRKVVHFLESTLGFLNWKAPTFKPPGVGLPLPKIIKIIRKNSPYKVDGDVTACG